MLDVGLASQQVEPPLAPVAGDDAEPREPGHQVGQRREVHRFRGRHRRLERRHQPLAVARLRQLDAAHAAGPARLLRERGADRALRAVHRGGHLQALR